MTAAFNEKAKYFSQDFHIFDIEICPLEPSQPKVKRNILTPLPE
jgi:hypothetical protein